MARPREVGGEGLDLAGIAGRELDSLEQQTDHRTAEAQEGKGAAEQTDLEDMLLVLGLEGPRKRHRSCIGVRATAALRKMGRVHAVE